MFRVSPILRKTLLLLLVGCALFPRPAYAYLDPGTGSYFFQMVLAVFVSALVAVKHYWSGIRSYVGRLFSRETVEKKRDG